MDAFERFVRAGLERRDTPVDETDIAVMRAAEAVYGPGIRALLDADLGGAAPEIGLDPSAPPRPVTDQ